MSWRHPVVTIGQFDDQNHPAAIKKLELRARTYKEMNMCSTAHWESPNETLVRQ